MTIGRDLLLEMIGAIEHDVALADRVRLVLGMGPTAAAEPAVIYLRVPAYARRASMSERSVWSLVARGLPTIGAGRSRRVDVARADGWLRDQREAVAVDGAVETKARRAARRAAGRVTR